MSQTSSVLYWRKSSHSTNTGGQCVEVANLASTVAVHNWRKSSHSDNTGGQCVEVAALIPGVAVRDSQDPNGPKLLFGSREWRAFTTQVRKGSLDLR